ncbi:putative ribonuclease H-like domain-containing protein [Tanacetum coccineum]|uniref:Ribonuclease H-like domain-containing protein n=1 Tax=Tanacetum coccineum TaxID=301880 RepID=A0ABQ5HAS9_9ASTR
MELKKPVQALKDPSWVEAMQDELLQIKLLKVWTLVDLPRDKWAIGTKWVFRNDERGIVVRNKARLVTQGLKVQQKKDGIFISQDKYVADILKKFDFATVKIAQAPHWNAQALITDVRWNSRRGPEFTWEREDQFRKKYPHLFTKTAPSSSAAS